jgi:drug/metabolite transporter (DMT)-like permease
MHAAGAADAWWASFVFRITASCMVLAAAALRRPALRLGGWPLPIVLGVGLGDTLGNLLFAAAAGRGLVSLTSVLASLYPIVTVILAALVLKERVARMQYVGIVLTLAGVGLISA